VFKDQRIGLCVFGLQDQVEACTLIDRQSLEKQKLCQKGANGKVLKSLAILLAGVHIDTRPHRFGAIMRH
jgi:hypothetical protein